MTEQEMKARTKAFALRVIRLTEAMPAKRSADVIASQLLRSGTAVGANYRAARRARSTAEFISRLSVVEEEADESSYWMELLVESELVPLARLKALIDECDEITRIIVATIRSAKRRRA
ncbi:MAG: four helix bundle protein [Phycisphaerales bacterium]